MRIHMRAMSFCSMVLVLWSLQPIPGAAPEVNRVVFWVVIALGTAAFGAIIWARRVARQDE